MGWVRRNVGRVRIFNSLCAVAFGFAASCFAADRPNILFIMSDDHAAQAISAYDDSRIETPHLDRLADEGMRFANAFCTNAICGPARSVTLTGKYSHVNGFIANEVTSFDGAQQTFPKLLQKAGYETALIGKWHLGSDPTGFDYWKILVGQGAYYDAPFQTAEGQVRSKGYVTDVITDMTVEWLGAREDDRPFMLMYQHKAPHSNFMPGPQYRDWREDETIPEPATLFDDYATRSPAAWDNEMRIDPMLDLQYGGDQDLVVPHGLKGRERTKWLYQFYIKNYLRCVKSIDDGVGRVLAKLEEMGELDNTVVIYTSDQGFFLGEHGYYDKRFMYEESLRIPLLVRYPKLVEPGSVADAMALNLDFAQTILDLAGVEAPADMQGRSLAPVLRGEAPEDWRDAMYYHFYEYPGFHYVKRHYGIRTDRYKLIRFYHDIEAWELYDLHSDPNELNNLAGQPGHAALFEEMKGRLAALQASYGDSPELAEEFIRRYPRGSVPSWGRYPDFPWRD